ncbi:MAG: hypothetical protein J0I48_17875 [Devosia sp.]|uniref:hypothetical protein n=1 Tax=Devosia sp. 66-22 TaxID=1895753 RepID=UPI00092988DA|nr:hypothetical protein [Devosia sp. 66-22]MBN9348039.1 hypothetical protein [Devosia sp.]OJX46550.1 MAG: hypothetical protein BGO81_04115 [Devosia sp. 66-22]
MYNTDYPDRADLPSTFKLIRSTVVAGFAAIAILVTIVLPSEYGIDPFRVGGMLGLTQMGEIKVQLAQEAAAQAQAAAGQTVVPTSAASRSDPAVAGRIAALEQAVAALQSQSDRTIAPRVPTEPTAPVEAIDPVPVAGIAPLEPVVAVEPVQKLVADWRDEISFVLTPGQGTEYKLVMAAGAAAEYEWLVDGGVINVDVHGEGNGQSVKYEQVRGVPVGNGALLPPFDGTHGWFFRNRGSADVVVTLRVRGDYTEMKKLV